MRPLQHSTTRPARSWNAKTVPQYVWAFCLPAFVSAILYLAAKAIAFGSIHWKDLRTRFAWWALSLASMCALALLFSMTRKKGLLRLMQSVAAATASADPAATAAQVRSAARSIVLSFSLFREPTAVACLMWVILHPISIAVPITKRVVAANFEGDVMLTAALLFALLGGPGHWYRGPLFSLALLFVATIESSCNPTWHKGWTSYALGCIVWCIWLLRRYRLFDMAMEKKKKSVPAAKPREPSLPRVSRPAAKPSSASLSPPNAAPLLPTVVRVLALLLSLTLILWMLDAHLMLRQCLTVSSYSNASLASDVHQHAMRPNLGARSLYRFFIDSIDYANWMFSGCEPQARRREGFSGDGADVVELVLSSQTAAVVLGATLFGVVVWKYCTAAQRAQKSRADFAEGTSSASVPSVAGYTEARMLLWACFIAAGTSVIFDANADAKALHTALFPGLLLVLLGVIDQCITAEANVQMLAQHDAVVLPFASSSQRRAAFDTMALPSSTRSAVDPSDAKAVLERLESGRRASVDVLKTPASADTMPAVPLGTLTLLEYIPRMAMAFGGKTQRLLRQLQIQLLVSVLVSLGSFAPLTAIAQPPGALTVFGIPFPMQYIIVMAHFAAGIVMHYAIVAHRRRHIRLLLSRVVPVEHEHTSAMAGRELLLRTRALRVFASLQNTPDVPCIGGFAMWMILLACIILALTPDSLLKHTLGGVGAHIFEFLPKSARALISLTLAYCFTIKALSVATATSIVRI